MRILTELACRQVWSAAKSAKQLKHCLMYLAAYFFLHESEFPLSNVYISKRANFNRQLGERTGALLVSCRTSKDHIQHCQARLLTVLSVIKYNPLLLNAFNLVADLSGGSGTVFMLLLQRKYRFSVKKGVFYGACMTIIP